MKPLPMTATRHPQHPILEPWPNTYYSRAIYNPTVWREHDRWCLIARCEATNDPCSGRLGLGTGVDGVHFTLEPEPILIPEHPYEALGCEDPRLVRLEGTYVLTYVGKAATYGGGRICLAASDDLYHWRKHGPILHPRPGRWNDGQVKAGAIAPFQVKGQYVMFFLGERRPWHTAIGIAYSHDLVHWEEPKDNLVLRPRPGHFDSQGVEPGPPPVLTDAGILLVYNGWDARRVHCVGAALLDAEDPRRVLARTERPLLQPEAPWEQHGQVPNVVFATGLVYDSAIYRLYYGAADRVIGLARVPLPGDAHGREGRLIPNTTLTIPPQGRTTDAASAA